MPAPTPDKSILSFRPRPVQLLAFIRVTAADSRNVKFGDHALDRMEEREITTLDALRVLRTGHISGEITPGRSAGEWKCKIIAKRKGSREVGVVTVALRTGGLFVKTVEWETQ